MTNRSIQAIAYAQPMDMGGFPIRQPLPSQKIDLLDPFLLLHHANVKVPQHIDVKHAGVGPHPHRGFSPVTIIFEGGVHHRDSRGNDNVVYAGGTQWMNAGMGVIHSERPPVDIHEMGSKQELIQLWVNTPAKNKMDAPIYIPLTKEETPVVESADGLTRIQVIAGELHTTKGPIVPLSAVNMFTVQMQKGATYFIPFAPTHNAFAYVLKGAVQINQADSIDAFYMASFNKDGDGIEITAVENSLLLVGTGEPLNEPVASHGPFVMNNQTELMEAFRDYQLGKMGVLIED
ncbi:MAG: pirin family protein [Sediminibacterium sp.]|nr:MAG: Pirin-like [Chitinophagaceae bacterium]MDP1843523.1 pirin family protein [Sediminibacterium sp.]TXT29289.1 MAG: Pirin-like protein [Chitinophagaceae bacterium]